jgi:hypothetical protein
MALPDKLNESIEFDENANGEPEFFFGFTVGVRGICICSREGEVQQGI